jgi:rifampin ADP-ribosylating transferase
MSGTATTFAQAYFHGTKADLSPGDLIVPNFGSNYGRTHVPHVYLSSTLDAAIWGAELAAGGARGRIYVVEPTGALEDDPELTDRKFPGNPTKSYRSSESVRVIAEVINWTGHSAEQIKTMKDHVARIERGNT